MSNRGKGGSGDASKSLSAFATKHWGDALGGSAAVGSLLAHCLTACYLCCTVAMFVGVFAQARLPPSRRRRRRDPMRLFRALARSAGRRRLFGLFLLLLLLLLVSSRDECSCPRAERCVVCVVVIVRVDRQRSPYTFARRCVVWCTTVLLGVCTKELSVYYYYYL